MQDLIGRLCHETDDRWKIKDSAFMVQMSVINYNRCVDFGDNVSINRESGRRSSQMLHQK